MVTIFNKRLLATLVAVVMTSSLGSAACASATAQNQIEGVSVAGIHEQTALIKAETLDVRATGFNPSDRDGMVQVADLSGGTGIRAVRPATLHNNPFRVAAGNQTIRTARTEAGNNAAPRFFLLTGFALIVTRIVVSRRSQRVKSLETGAK
ncbi:MAG: hypothetical protein ABW172_00190 [Candidatus Binatia bacterium]